MVKMAKFIKTWREGKLKLINRALFPVFDRIMYSYFAGNFWKVHKVLKRIHRSQCSFHLMFCFHHGRVFSSPYYFMEQQLFYLFFALV